MIFLGSDIHNTEGQCYRLTTAVSCEDTCNYRTAACSLMLFSDRMCESNVYWTVHHCHS